MLQLDVLLNTEAWDRQSVPVTCRGERYVQLTDERARKVMVWTPSELRGLSKNDWFESTVLKYWQLQQQYPKDAAAMTQWHCGPSPARCGFQSVLAETLILASEWGATGTKWKRWRTSRRRSGWSSVLQTESYKLHKLCLSFTTMKIYGTEEREMSLR